MDSELDAKVYRLDGQTSAYNRNQDINSFNTKKEAAVFLISTKAGSLGVNLHTANRVIIYDVSWNPSHDLQAIFRAYRYGQKNKVFIYRLVANGTMEHKIYERQMMKQGLALRVVDEKQIDRLFDQQQAEQLFQLEEQNDDDDVVIMKKNP